MTLSIRRRDGGYFNVPNRWIDAGYMAKAPGSVTQVYLFLCRWADNTTLAVEQPIRFIGHKCGLSENIVQQALRTLESWGVIERQWKPGPKGYNLWTLNDLEQRAPEFPPKSGRSLSDRGHFLTGSLSDPPYINLSSDQPEYPDQPDVSVSRKSRIPDDWGPTDRTMNVLFAEGFTKEQITEQVAQFRDWQIADGKQLVEWDAAFKNWMRRAREFGRFDTPSRNGHDQGVRVKDAKGNYTVEGLAAIARGEKV